MIALNTEAVNKVPVNAMLDTWEKIAQKKSVLMTAIITGFV